MTRGVWLLRVVSVSVMILIVHVGIAPDIRISGVAAELPIGFAIAAGLTGGVERGAIFGFIFGLMVDMFLFTPIGLSALVFGLVGWVSGHVFMDRIEESPIMSALAIGVGTGIGLTAFVFIGIALGEGALAEAPITRIVLIASLINAVASVVFMLISHWMWTVDPLGRRAIGRS